MTRWLAILLTLAWVPCARAQSGCPSTTALGSVACAMSGGTWHSVTGSAMTNWSNGTVLGPTAQGSVTEFAERGQWDSTLKQIVFLGGSHATGGFGPCPNNEDLFIHYTDSNNTWHITNTSGVLSDLPDPCPSFDNAFSSPCTAAGCGIGHDYDHDVLVGDDLYHRQYNSGKVMKFTWATQTWSQCSVFNSTFMTYQVAGSLMYFPDRNSLIMVDGDWGVWELSLAGGNCTGGWTELASTFGGGMTPVLNGFGGYQIEGAYSQLCRCIIFGGGSRGLNGIYKMDSSANFTTFTNPSNINLNSGGGTILTVDPISGRFIVIDGSCNAWIVNPTGSETWTNSGTTPTFCPYDQPGPSNSDTIAVPISTYGVIAFISSEGSNGAGQVNLYKVSSVANGDAIFRCDQPTTFMCNMLAQTSDITGAYGSNKGNCCAGSTAMAIDNTVFPANGGSMVCAIPVNAAGDDPCSDFFQNFGATNGATTFTDGQTFYIQYMMWMDAAYLADEPTSGEGQKQSIIGQGDPPTCTVSSSTTCVGSCTDPEQVTLNNSYRGNPSGFPQHYTSCSVFNPLNTPVSTSWNSNNFLDQTNRNNCYNYLNPASGQTGSTFFAPFGNCVPYPTGQWFSIEEELTIGTFSTSCPNASGVTNCNANSVLNVWVAPVGQAYTQTMASTFNLYNNSHATFGKIWLLTYNTSATHWAGGYNVRWAELMGSTTFIPAPQTDSSSSPGPVTLSPSSNNFGTKNVGTSSSPATFTLTNNNSATATSITPTLGGTNPLDFSISNTGAGSCSAAGGSLAMGASCTFTVTFTPTVPGARTATLSVSYSGGDGASPQTASLSGTGNAFTSNTQQGMFARLLRDSH